MKKYFVIAVLAMCLVVGGCATIQSWLGKTVCSPTADQVAVYAQQISEASDALVYFQGLMPSIPVAAIVTGLKMAIKVLADARDGICQDPTQIASAQSAVADSTNMAASLKMGMQLKLTR